MAYMEWSSAYSIGVPIFDEEHKKLIAMIGALHRAIEAGTHLTMLKDIENDLIEYAIVHFQHEEMYFDDYDYPSAVEHKAQHAKMKEHIFSFRERIVKEPSAELCAEMLDLLRNWLARHIQIEDKKFGDFLVAHGHGVTTPLRSPR